MTVDRALVTRKLLLIASDLEALRPVAADGRDTYRADPIRQGLTERYLERLIGRMIDVNYHLITGSGQPPPDYFESFERLGELGALAPDFAATSRARPGFATESCTTTTPWILAGCSRRSSAP